MNESTNAEPAKENKMTKKEVEVFAVKGAVDWKSLTDVQWMNIVNHDHAFENHDKESAVHLAVKMTEAKLKELNYAALCAQPSRGEVVAWMVTAPNGNTTPIKLRADMEHFKAEGYEIIPLCRCDAPAHPLAKQVAAAQAEMATWTDERKAGVQLQGDAPAQPDEKDAAIAILREELRIMKYRFATGQPAPIEDVRTDKENSVHVANPLAEGCAPRVPVGWALVPLMPTEEMVSALMYATMDAPRNGDPAELLVRAVIAAISAAPEYKEALQ